MISTPLHDEMDPNISASYKYISYLGGDLGGIVQFFILSQGILTLSEYACSCPTLYSKWSPLTWPTLGPFSSLITIIIHAIETWHCPLLVSVYHYMICVEAQKVISILVSIPCLTFIGNLPVITDSKQLFFNIFASCEKLIYCQNYNLHYYQQIYKNFCALVQYTLSMYKFML